MVMLQSLGISGEGEACRTKVEHIHTNTIAHLSKAWPLHIAPVFGGQLNHVSSTWVNPATQRLKPKVMALHQATATMTCWSTCLFYLDIHQSLEIGPDMIVPGVAGW